MSVPDYVPESYVQSATESWSKYFVWSAPARATCSLQRMHTIIISYRTYLRSNDGIIPCVMSMGRDRTIEIYNILFIETYLVIFIELLRVTALVF